MGVQLARLSVLVTASVVVDAEGDVAGLLDFGDEASCADGVDAPGGDEEGVAGADAMAGEGVADGVGGYGLPVLAGVSECFRPL